VLAQRAREDGARWMRAVALNLGLSRWGVIVKNGGIQEREWCGQWGRARRPPSRSEGAPPMRTMGVPLDRAACDYDDKLCLGLSANSLADALIHKVLQT
jgi:hypothetical protein